MHRLTASGLDRASACSGSLVLPQHPHATRDTEWGLVVAKFRDDYNKHGRGYALGQIDDPTHAARCAAIDMDSMPKGCETEVAIAYDPESDTAERLVLDAHRAYPDDGRIYGTADRVGLLSPHVLYLADDKTGSVKVRAQRAMQLRFLALAFCRLLGIEEAQGAMTYLRHDGTWFSDRFSFDAMDLDDTREELLQIRARGHEAARAVAAGGIPQLVPGLHCEHCAAAPECPAQARQQAALVERGESGLVEWFGELDEARAGALAEQAIVVAKIAEKVREAANARAAALPDGLPLPSGRVLKRVQYGAQVMDAEAKETLARVKGELREAGHISTERTWQIRVVGGARKAG